MQTTTTCLQKSKETYLQRCAELEKLKKENATSKEIVKAESKVLRSREEYRNYVDKYANVRNEFEDKMLKASRSFQAHDKAFLQQFKLFLLSFAEAMDERVSASSQVYAQYKESIENIDIDDLMRRFVEKKGTGKDRPEHIVFEEIDTVGGDVSATATTSGPSSSNSSAIMHPLTQAEPVPPSANDLLTIEAEAHENQENHWNGTARNTQPSSPILSDSGSSPPVTPVPPTQPSFSASLGRQKLAAWLPGKRKKRASQCSLPAGDIPVNEPHGSTENTGFLKKYRSKTKKSMTDLTSASERQSHSAWVSI
ncbi:hypothetical protein AB6A40_009744 [Gnathostoma spinigerum]|uniref:GMIP/FCHO2-like FCH domain-containing protein n=1 Tax=Gnathostoma spinigerum TaxID=75299 RepID=A0ABD6EU43_9BILA